MDTLELNTRAGIWKSTMKGHAFNGVTSAHATAGEPTSFGTALTRVERETRENATLSPGATRSEGAGNRQIAELPHLSRTCFERDYDRILHSSALRRLAGKTQVYIFPRDHQRTRLTHALEVTQVSLAIARGLRLNEALVQAIALGHDCGHGPGGHASEDVFAEYLPDFDHASWGADVSLSTLNLCKETLDGVRNHSWSRPRPSTPEGEVVSFADRIAYCAHDFEDARLEGLVSESDLPARVRHTLSTSRSIQLGRLIEATVETSRSAGFVCLDNDSAQALSEFRAYNYERIYTRPETVAQARAIKALLSALVEFFISHPHETNAADTEADPVFLAVAYVAGMTDRFAYETAEQLLSPSPVWFNAMSPISRPTGH